MATLNSMPVNGATDAQTGCATKANDVAYKVATVVAVLLLLGSFVSL